MSGQFNDHYFRNRGRGQYDGGERDSYCPCCGYIICIKELRKRGETMAGEGEIDRLLEKSAEGLARLNMMLKGERVSFTRTNRERTIDMTIYVDQLTNEQKLELERIHEALFTMADEVTEKSKQTLKSSEKEP